MIVADRPLTGESGRRCDTDRLGGDLRGFGRGDFLSSPETGTSLAILCLQLDRSGVGAPQVVIFGLRCASSRFVAPGMPFGANRLVI